MVKLDMKDTNDRKERSPLLPLRHPQRDFFVCDIFDAAPKSDMASMEHPLFTLSTKPDMKPCLYENNGSWIEIKPSFIGRATVFDRDILIYCISQCMAMMKEGRDISRTMRFSAHDLLKATNRDTSDKGYAGFKSALERLRNTSIETNIQMGGVETLKGFGFISEYEIVKETRDGRMLGVEIVLSDWLFNAIDAKGKDILTISPRYFQLRKPLERRLYEIARKHCGQNNKWSFKLETLKRKTGSRSSDKEFKRMVRAIVDTNKKTPYIPDYSFELENNLFTIRPRSEFIEIYSDNKTSAALDGINLKAVTYETAKKFAGGYDIYSFLIPEWKEMLAIKKTVPDNPDGSFIGYVKWYVSKHGVAR